MGVKQLVRKLDDGRNLLFQLIGVRSLQVFPLGAIEELDEEGEITSICYGENKEVLIKLNEYVQFNENKFKIKKINKIKGSGKGGYKLVIHTLSKSSQFIMPFLGETKAFYRWDINFCNCFIGTEELGDYGSSIYLLYRWDGSSSFVNFENALVSHPWYAGLVDVDEHHMMYEFSIPEAEVDIAKIINGKYSKISEKSKQKILKFHNIKSKESTLYGILYRTVHLMQKKASELFMDIKIFKEIELASEMKPQNEIYLKQYEIRKEENEENKETLW